MLTHLAQNLLKGGLNILQPALEQLVDRTVVLQAPEYVLDRAQGVPYPTRHEVFQGPGQGREYLRVLRHGVQSVLEDGAHIIEADLEEHLGPDPLYFELHLVQPGVHSDLQANQTRKLRHYRDVRPEVPDRQLDLVDLEL